MSEADNQRRFDCHALVLRADRPAIWAQNGIEGWGLPRLTLQITSRLPISEVVAAIEQLVAAPLIYLFEAYRLEDEETGQMTVALALHVPEGNDPAGDGRWLTADEAAALDLPAPIAERMRACLSELESGEIPVLRAPWARFNWYSQMMTWVHEQLQQLDLHLTGLPELVRSWGLSYVSRIPTSGGVLYFKAVSAQPLFVNEPVVTGRLAQYYPQQIPRPLAIHAENRWMLLPDVGEVVGFDAPYEQAQEMVRSFARLQIDAAGHVDGLLKAGCLDRRLPVLAGQIISLWEHPTTMSDLNEREIARLQKLAGRLMTDCERLGSYHIPHTLGHGDFHGSNVTRQGENLYIIDWTDACIMHPFLDMVMIQFHDDTAEQERLWDHYLSLWQRFEPLPRLREALTIARPLMCLHQTISYQFILDNLEPWAQSDLAWAPAYWLRTLLASYPD